MDVHIRRAGSRHGRVDVRRRASLTICLCLTLLLSQVAGADSPSGHISAVRHEALPAEMTILVRSGNAIPAGRRAANCVVGGLLERGFEASTLAGVLRLDIRLATNIDIDPWESKHWRFEPEGLRYRSRLNERNIIDFYVKPDAALARWRWTFDDAVPALPSTSKVAPRILLAELRDRHGRLLWSARAELSEAFETTDGAIDMLAEAVADNFGETVEDIGLD